MQVLIKKIGGSAVVPIPAHMMTAASLSIGQAVEVRAENGRVVIEPASNLAYSLDALLSDMRPETFPRAEDLGPSVGQELW